MRNGRVYTGLRVTARAEKHAWKQAAAGDPAGEVTAAIIASAEANEIPVGRNVAVTAEEATGALPEIGNDHDIGFVISGACFEPGFPFAHVVGRSKVCVP